MYESGASLATILVVIQIVFYVVGWVIFAAVVREERAPITYWIGFLLCLSVGFFSEELRIKGATSLTPSLLSVISFSVGFPLVTRALESFLRLKPRDTEYAITILILLLSCFVVNYGFDGRYNVAFKHFVQTLVLLRTLSLTQRALLQQYGALTHRIIVTGILAWTVFSFAWGIAGLLYPGFGDFALQAHGNRSEIMLFATMVALALFNAVFVAALFFKLVTRVRELSERDPLTGLFNRRAFYERVKAATERVMGEGGDYSVLLLDLDHFKQINDRHGHAAGDAVLIATAEVLRRETRASNVVCRWGGEEFAILLNGCGADDAVNVAERIRRAVAEMDFSWQGVSIPLTTSIGVAAPAAMRETIDHKIARCDRALYQAKAQNRNRWVLASCDVGGGLDMAAAAMAG